MAPLELGVRLAVARLGCQVLVWTLRTGHCYSFTRSSQYTYQTECPRSKLYKALCPVATTLYVRSPTLPRLPAIPAPHSPLDPHCSPPLSRGLLLDLLPVPAAAALRLALLTSLLLSLLTAVLLLPSLSLLLLAGSPLSGLDLCQNLLVRELSARALPLVLLREAGTRKARWEALRAELLVRALVLDWQAEVWGSARRVRGVVWERLSRTRRRVARAVEHHPLEDRHHRAQPLVVQLDRRVGVQA